MEENFHTKTIHIMNMENMAINPFQYLQVTLQISGTLISHQQLKQFITEQPNCHSQSNVT